MKRIFLCLINQEIHAIGLISNYQQNKFNKDLEDIINVIINNAKEKDNICSREIEQSIKQGTKKHITRKMRKFPIIIHGIFL